jgi:hypothetical protein
VSFASPNDLRLIADIEKLTKQKIELEAVEFESDRPRERINTGRRTWDEERVARESRNSNPSYAVPKLSKDPFFDKPYEPSAPSEDVKPSWESAPSRTGSRNISANIKSKRKVAALFKG